MDFTVLIKTHERPNCLKRLLASLHRYYPTVPVLVADDSKGAFDTWYHGHQVRAFGLPEGSGLSRGRNFLLGHCGTPYFITFDDDFIVTEDSDLESLVEYVRTDIFHLAGASMRLNGSVCHFEGWINLDPPDLTLTSSKQGNMPMTCDIVPNCFAARTAQIGEFGWDDELLMGEHIDFFLRCQRAGVRVGHVPMVVVDHCPDRENTEYAKARDRLQKACEPIWRKKWGIKSISGGLS